jgi:teichuronic acid biosynthesis glycosyltransferase TuaG
MYLSIILTYFKKKKYIKRTLNSIIGQSFNGHELIIIYDQVDRTDISYIKKILKNKIRYRIIRNNRNLGVGKSRNIGIKKSKGKFIAFCDADDVWHKKKSEIQLKIMREKKLNFSHTSYNLINTSNKIIGRMKVKKILKYNDLLKSCDIALSSVIIRRSVLKKSFKFGHTKTKEDYLLWLKLSKILEIHGVNKKLLYWRKTKNSLSSNILQKFYDAFIVYNQIENKNLLITFFYVFRLSIFYVIKKIRQKIF